MNGRPETGNGQREDPRRGAILIVVLVVLSGLSLLALGVAHRSRLESRVAQYQYERAYVRELAEGGLAVAVARLREDSNDVDHLAEPWAAGFSLGRQGWLTDQAMRFRQSHFLEVSCADEQGKLNLNQVGSEQLAAIAGLDAEAAASLLDWLDPDDSRRALGAESAYYQALPTPYLAKNQPVDLLQEALLVRGVSPAAYYGEDADMDGILDPSENDGMGTYPADDADGYLLLGLRDLLTAHGDGRVNINTAPAEVLLMIPGMSEEAANAIVEGRAGADGEPGTEDDQPIEDLADVRRLSGVSGFEADVLAGLGRLDSEYFRIVSRAGIKGGRVTCELELTVRRADGNVEPILRRELWHDPRAGTDYGG